MRTIVFLLEELSAKEFLKGLLPRLLINNYCFRFISFEGKQDLEKQLVRKLRGWRTPNTKFVVLRDQDASDCTNVKNDLLEKCKFAEKESDTLVRVACREIESWYIGDLSSVGEAYKIKNLGTKQAKSQYRTPDILGNPLQELESLTNGKYQKVSGSRLLGKKLSIDQNCSKSFNVFISGINRLVQNWV